MDYPNKIKCAAIQFRVKGESEVKVVTGRNHAECIQMMAELNLYRRDREDEVQGFMATDGEKDWFVDRYVAGLIAWKAGQLKGTLNNGILYSENVNY